MDTVISFLMEKLIVLPGIIIGLSFHEYAHAKVSDLLGDPTPRSQGRVTLNPMAHIDPIGLLLLFLIGFGWGKPVQIDPRFYKKKRLDNMLVALAGVTMNFLLAVVFMIIMCVMMHILPSASIQSGLLLVIWQILIQAVFINLVLMFFNLIPLPPLDGFNVITQIFKLDRKPWFDQFYRIGPMFLLILIVCRGTSFILMPPVNFVFNILYAIFI